MPSTQVEINVSLPDVWEVVLASRRTFPQVAEINERIFYYTDLGISIT